MSEDVSSLASTTQDFPTTSQELLGFLLCCLGSVKYMICGAMKHWPPRLGNRGDKGKDI